jgi:hypothetical protein
MYPVELEYRGEDKPHLVLTQADVEETVIGLKTIREVVCGSLMPNTGLGKITNLRNLVEKVCAQKALSTEVGKETIRDTDYVLHPDHISSLLTILKIAERVIKKEPPWNTQSAENGSLQIIDWFSTMIQPPKK